VIQAEYDFLRKLLKERSGLVLSDDKQYLIESRLMPLVRRANLGSLGELVAELRRGVESTVCDVVEAMTTNETFFFRDKIPFDHFKDSVLPELIKARANRKNLRIWCAAASTGQEPYSLAMILKDFAQMLSGWRVEIVATDLSQEVLEKCKSGIYSQFEVQRGLPIQKLVTHFKQIGETWQINADIRAMVQFRPLNLLNDFSSLGKFDVIFCRNVLIYFDQTTKADVLNRMMKVNEPDGYLFLGAAETVVGLTDAYRPCQQRRGVYLPKVASPSIAPAMGAGGFRATMAAR